MKRELLAACIVGLIIGAFLLLLYWMPSPTVSPMTVPTLTSDTGQSHTTVVHLDKPDVLRASNPEHGDDLPVAPYLRDVPAKLWWNPEGDHRCYVTVELNHDLIGYVVLPDDWCISLKR